jgi:hypothetical protein
MCNCFSRFRRGIGENSSPSDEQRIKPSQMRKKMQSWKIWQYENKTKTKTNVFAVEHAKFSLQQKAKNAHSYHFPVKHLIRHPIKSNELCSRHKKNKDMKTKKILLKDRLYRNPKNV